MVATHSELGRLVLEFQVVLEVVLRSSTPPPFMTIVFASMVKGPIVTV